MLLRHVVAVWEAKVKQMVRCGSVKLKMDNIWINVCIYIYLFDIYVYIYIHMCICIHIPSLLTLAQKGVKRA